MNHAELSPEQIERIDDIHNIVFELCLTMTENEDLEWDMEFIGPIADAAHDILEKCGHRVRYPSIVTDEDGSERTEDYYVEGE